MESASMPAHFMMTWEPRQRLWRKMYRGERYVVSCRQLAEWLGEPVPETKDGSYKQANAWWVSKKAEIDNQQPPHPHAAHLAELSRRRDWARGRDEPILAGYIGREMAKVEAGGRPQVDDFGHWDGSDEDFIAALTVSQRSSRDLFEVLRILNPGDPVWHERLKRDEPDPVPDDRTVGSQVGRYLNLERGRVDAKSLSISEYALARRCLEAFRDWIGAETPIEKIDADKWESYWQHLLGWDGSVEYKKKRFRYARNFIDWLASKGLIQPPPNLHNRRHRFGGSARSIPTMTEVEVRSLIERAGGQLRLHLLLMANCGMTQQDIAVLKQSEVDWDRGRITRKRSKTKSNNNVPTVTYQLWPHTFALLKQWRSDHPDLVLLTKSGRPWVHDELVGERRTKADNITINYRRLRAQLKEQGIVVKPLKVFRKTSSSLLDKHKEFGRYTGHFLGHAPRSTRDIHYVTPSQDRFDDAIEWLGQQYGFVEKRKR